MKRNKFSKALKHLKSKKRLDETAPTNSMSGVYQVSPSTGDAFRLGPKDPPKRFYPKADGTWPAGIPGDPNKIHYDRPAGYWNSGRNVVQPVGTPTQRDYSYADVQAKGKTDTTTLIRASDGKPYTAIPPNSESFILGPVATSYAINHGYDDYTNLGYIQKDTRQFVLLATIQGHFRGEDKPRTSYGGGFGRTWDGTSGQISIYNSNFTLEMALWMRDTYLEGNYKANFPFNFSGGIPVERSPDDPTMGEGDIIGTDDGQQSDDGHTEGEEQDDPDDTDLEKLDLWGLLKKKAREFGDKFDKAVEDGIEELVDALGDKFNEVMDGLIENLGKITNLESAANMLNKYDDFLKKNPNGSDERIDVTNEFSDKDLNILNDTRNDPIVNDAIDKAIKVNNDPDRADKPLVNKPPNSDATTVGELQWDIAKDAVTKALQDAVRTSNGLDNSIHNNVQIDFDEFVNSNGEDWTIIKNYEFRPGGSIEGAEDTPIGSALTDAGIELDSLGSGNILTVLGAVIAAKTGITGANQHGSLYNSPTMKYKVKVPKEKIKIKKVNRRGRTVESNLLEDKKRILREVKRPVLIEATPKTTKLKGYRPNFKGKFSPQNTPDVTASKKSDEAVHGYNTSRMAWTAKDKYWKGYETAERMNVIYDRVGFGQQYFDEISGENLRTKAKKKREVQEHLNQLAHQKAMREVYGVKEFQNKIDEAETYDNKVKDPLFAKVANRLKKEIDYANKPSPHGYPTEPPAKIDPKTGMHPKYGKRYKYDKLDPVSAVMMKRAPTGDPEIDANVKKAAQERKEHLEIDDKISEWMFGKLKRDWRKELDEGMTTANAISTILPAEGDVAIDQVSPVDATSFADVNNMFGAGADNPALDGTTIRANGSGSGSDGGFNVGGQYLAFQGTGSGGSRMALLKPMDATKVDTITITAIRGNGLNGGEEADIVGQEELFVIYKTPDMTRSSYLSQDRNQTNVGSFPADAAIIAIGQGNGTLQNYTITIPDYARQKDVVFGLFQLSHSGSGYDHYGVTDIKFQRRTPLNVVVPLDSPEAVSFIRVGSNEGDPKKRKKRVDDMLKASDEYTAKQMGGEFPGQGNRIDTRDPFAPSPLTDPDASPIGKEAVTKSFKDFGRDASAPELKAEPTPADEIEAGKPLSDFHSDADPSKTTEPEPEVEAEPRHPSSQATLKPKDEDGNEIPVKTVGKIAVQGADAAKLEAETEPEIEPVPETEPEIKPTSVDKPNQPGSGLETRKRQQEKLDEITDELIKRTDYVAHDVAGMNEILSTMTYLVGAFNDNLNPISWIVKGLGGKVNSGKLVNNLNIARSIFSGKVENHIPLTHEIKTFTNSLIPTIFDEDSPSYIPISGQRHPYADDNIVVDLEGNVSINDGTYQGLANKSYAALGDSGKGYAQLIIPEDGGRPYVHYYDYNYHNLNSPESGEVPNVEQEIASAFTHLLGEMGLVKSLLTAPFIGALKKAIFNFEEVFDSLKNKSGLEGWPPGIHGAALTDFKVDIRNLPEKTQQMIANHPLSWTDARVSQMSDEFLEEQFARLIGTEGVKYKFDTEQDIDNFYEGVERIMNQRGLVINPEFKEGFIEGNRTWNEIQDANEQRKAIVDSKEFDLARLKAQEDYQKLWDDYEKAITREELHKNFSKGVKIPDPKTDGDKMPDWSEWTNSQDKTKYDSLIAQQDKYLNAAFDYFNGTHKKISNKFFSYQDSLPREGDKVVGTDEEIAKLNRLYNEYQRSSDKYDALFAKQDAPMIEAGDLLNKFIEDYDRRMEVWKPYNKELNRVFAEVDGLYKPLIDETFIAYQNTVNPIEGTEDGIPQYVNGGDYTDRDGKVYKGMGTLTKDIDELLEQLNSDMEKYNEMVGKYGVRYLMGTLSQFIIRKPYGGKTPDWSPENKGKGSGTGGSATRPKPPSDRDYYAGLDEPVFFGGSNKKNNKKGGGAMTASRKMEGTPLFERLKTRGFFNPKDIKPTFPPNDPPEIDKETGMHSNYGKQAGRYKKLDPMSANAMPATGDPEIDAVVDKQRTDKTPEQKKKDYIKTASTIKKLAKKR